MKIIFFDGLCPMCHSWVKRIITWDKKRVFHYAPLESEIAGKTLEKEFPEYLKEDTIVYYEDGKIYTRSTALLHILRQLPSPYSLLYAGIASPLFFRDAMYRWVASRRYTFGRRYESCPVPPVESRDRFLN